MLQKRLSLATGVVREYLGTPSRLATFLHENAHKLKVASLDAGQTSIAADSVPRWHEWGQPSRSDGVALGHGEILGWKVYPNFGYRSCRTVRADLAEFGSRMRVARWRCDIQDIDGLQARDADLGSFSSLDALAQHSMATLTQDVSSTGLARLLAQREIQLLGRHRSSDYFVCPLWDGRIFLINGGASRHFAAARYLAAQLRQRVTLGAELQIHSIEPKAVSTLRRDFELFAISAHDTFANIGFHEIVRESRTPYFSKRMPRPQTEVEVMFLPRNDHRSMRLAAEMRAAGFPDMGKHLSTLLLRQHMNALRPGSGQTTRAA